jgi:hypothetical protein
MKDLPTNHPNPGLNASSCHDPFQVLFALFPIEREFWSTDCSPWNSPEQFKSSR